MREKLTCEACGRHIEPEEVAEDTVEAGMIVCASCFVEGKCQRCGAFPSDYWPFAKEVLCPDCAGDALEEFKERTGLEVCSVCGEPIQGAKVANPEQIGEEGPLCFDCYLQLKEATPEAMLDYCQQYGNGAGIRYYPWVGKSLCPDCAKGIPDTEKS